MILVIDNYDSFVETLARYVRESGMETLVVRNDAHAAAELIALRPAGVIVSPGPNGPAEAGVSLELISRLDIMTPLLGVCLGHQCLVETIGGRTVRALEPMHGEASPIDHDGEGLFADLPNPFLAGRYHSLISELPPASDLCACAWSARGELMAVRHRTAPRWGVQFHPESVLTPVGRILIERFVAAARQAPRP